MRLAKSERYHGKKECRILLECERQYCFTHRLLWNDCETAKHTMDADYVNGRPRQVWSLGDCPECERLAEIEIRKVAGKCQKV